MTSRLTTTLAIATILGAALTLPASLTARCDASGRKAGNGTLGWSVVLCGSGCIEATIDTRDVDLANDRIEDVCFEATFFDSAGRVLKRQSFYFTDSKVPCLDEGFRFHRRRFSHSLSSAAKVATRNLCFSLRRKGTRYAKPDAFTEPGPQAGLAERTQGVKQY